jgi:hypothetical protein
MLEGVENEGGDGGGGRQRHWTGMEMEMESRGQTLLENALSVLGVVELPVIKPSGKNCPHVKLPTFLH